MYMCTNTKVWFLLGNWSLIFLSAATTTCVIEVALSPALQSRSTNQSVGVVLVHNGTVIQCEQFATVSIIALDSHVN